MSVRTSVAIRGVSKFRPKAQMTSSTPKSGNNRRASRARIRRMARAQRKPGSLHARSQEPVIHRKGQARPAGKRRLCGRASLRGMLIPPVSAVGDFVRDISLLGLVVIVEMPRQIADGTEPEDEQEQSTLRGLARDKTREKILDVFQKYLSARENGLAWSVRSTRRPLAVCCRRREERGSHLVLSPCLRLSSEFHSDPAARRPRRFLASISR